MRSIGSSFVVSIALLWASLTTSGSSQNVVTDSRAAQTQPNGSQEAGPPLLNQNDGLDILSAALESRRVAGGNDCSHLVHAVYKLAGFPYPYSSSRELYAGIEQFQAVTQPQPGDLVVWRGHVGIIISPLKRSFFSKLRSGRGVEKYDSPYWRRRGRPRFFRYVKDVYGFRGQESSGD